MALLRRLAVDVRMKVVDDELFADEHETSTFQCVNIVAPDGQRATLVKHVMGVGGEVRAELDLTTRRGTGEVVVVEGSLKLFEGTSEATNELEDTTSIFLEIPPNEHVEHWTAAVNGPGFQDTAEVTLTFNNVDALHEVAQRGGVPLMARHSGKVLDVAGASMDPGAPIIQFGANDQLNQRFLIEPVRDALVRLVAVHSGLVLDVAGASMDDGAPLMQFPWHGNNNQVFRLVPTNGDVVIVAEHSGKVLDVAGVAHEDGTPITQFTQNFQANQQWTF